MPGSLGKAGGWGETFGWQCTEERRSLPGLARLLQLLVLLVQCWAKAGGNFKWQKKGIYTHVATSYVKGIKSPIDTLN
jgi:hypothetical protein